MLGRRCRAIAVALLLSSGPAAAMSFETLRLEDRQLCRKGVCPTVIVARGRIDDDSAEEFVRFARTMPESRGMKNILLLESPGGNVAGSMKLGIVLRKLGTVVVVAQPAAASGGSSSGALRSARCYSACAYALMGGTRRIVPPGSQVGVHRMHALRTGPNPTGEEDLYNRHQYGSDNQVQFLSRYVASMGISTEMVAVAERVAPESIRVLTAAEMRRYGLAASKL